jgi:hypothetical protein
MKTICIAILLVIIFASTASAGSGSLNPLDAGKQMISGGIDTAIRDIADDLMDFVCGTENETENETITGSGERHDSITKTIIGFASWSVKPFSYPSMQWMLGLTFAVAVGVMLAYIFVGAAAANLSNASPSKYRDLQSVLLGNERGNNGMENYAQNVVAGMLGMAFMALVIWVTMQFGATLKLMIMESIANSIAPSVQSVSVLYLMMAIMWVCLSVSFGISNVVICITAGISFLLGALYASDRTRHLTTGWLDYFLSMVLMQVFVVGIVALIVGIVMDIKTGEYWYLMPPGMESSIYIGMTLFMVGLCFAMIIGKITLFKTAKTIVRIAI